MPITTSAADVLLVIAAAALTPAFLTACRAAEQKDVEVKCPSGIDQSAWDRLLKKYVDENGLVNYAAWKSKEEDVDALDSYLKQFAPKGDNPAEGNEKVAWLVNAYNAITIRTILGAYPVESIHEGISGRVLRFKRVGAVKLRKNLAHLRVLHSQLSSKVPLLCRLRRQLLRLDRLRRCPRRLFRLKRHHPRSRPKI